MDPLLQESEPTHQESSTLSHILKKPFNSEEVLQEIKQSQMLTILPKNRPRQQSEPSYREIVQTYDFLKERMPSKDTEKIIRMLHANLVSAKQNKLEHPAPAPTKKELKGWEDLMEAKEIQISPIKFKEYSIRPLVREKKFLKVGEEGKFIQRQVVAKAFVQREYGLQHLQAEIAESKSLVIIRRNRYTDIAYAVVTEAYRTLEHFLINECKRSIKPADKFQMGSLHSFLCNCRLLLKPQDSLTFLKFVRIAYNLQSVAINEEAAVRLYISIQKEIKSKVGNRQLDRSTIKRKWTKYLNMKRRDQFDLAEFKKFITPELEREVVKEYLKTKLVWKAKAYLWEKYPQKKNLFTLQSVKGIFCKLVRIMIKRVFYYCEKYKHLNLPKILPIDSSYRCMFSKGPESLGIRIHLLKMWLLKEKKVVKKLPSIIYEMNNFIQYQENQKFNYVIAKAKPDTSIIDKLDFNINVSRTKLTEGFKMCSKDEVVLKGTERNFQHYLNIENGKNMHYYRKIGHNYYPEAVNPDDIKIEDLDEDCSDSSSDSNDNHQESEKASGNETEKSVVTEPEEDEGKAETVIKEWIQRLNLQFFKCIK